MTLPDPRPLPGEPLALDLLDTEFMLDGRPADLLANPETLDAWSAYALGPEQSTSGIGEPLRQARAAIRAVVSAVTAHPGAAVPQDARDALNEVLAHGLARRRLGTDGPEPTVEADDPRWLPAVRASYDLLDILTDRADRIRQCEHDRCVLWFLDTSRNGTRRWCLMARCGNRAKAERHYRRTRAGSADRSADAMG